MAVPGNINQPGSAGCNNLIKAGAIPVTEAGDIFFALGLKRPPAGSKPPPANLSRRQRSLLDLISAGIADQEELAAACQLDGAALGSALTALELAGAVRPEGAGRWVVS
jgi:DNA processing protein